MNYRQSIMVFGHVALRAPSSSILFLRMVSAIGLLDCWTFGQPDSQIARWPDGQCHIAIYMYAHRLCAIVRAYIMLINQKPIYPSIRHLQTYANERRTSSSLMCAEKPPITNSLITIITVTKHVALKTKPPLALHFPQKSSKSTFSIRPCE